MEFKFTPPKKNTSSLDYPENIYIHISPTEMVSCLSDLC